jgi:hypothetical protein
MIQNLISMPKDELQITRRSHHQPNFNHDANVFLCTKYSLVDMFILVKDEIKHLDSCILTLYLASKSFFSIPKCEHDFYN